MSLDFEKINRKINDIDENVRAIKKYSSLPDEKFWKDERNILAIKHLLLQAIEATGAICLHISAHSLRKSVENMADCFRNLYNAKIINANLCRKLEQMSKFRNKLVHHYQKIDDEEVLKFSHKDLKDFEEFVREIGKTLKI